MYANPSLYDRSNFLQVRDGAKMIRNIKNELEGRQIDTILDVGCGTGNLTEMMYRELKPKRIVAFDLAQDMISFAKSRQQSCPTNSKMEEQSRGSGVHYYQANACEPFEQLADKLGLAASSVDVVISFYCIHWVPDKRQTCDNIFRFLKQNGRFYLIISVWNDLFPVQHRIIEHPYWRSYLMQWVQEMRAGASKQLQPQQEQTSGQGDRGKPGQESKQELNEETLVGFEIQRKPDYDLLHDFWKNLCLGAALVMEEMDLIFTDYPFKQIKDFNDQVEAVCYWLNYVPLHLHNHFLADYFDLIQREYVAEQIKTQKRRRRSLNILEPNQLSAQARLMATMTPEQEAVTMFRFDYIYATISGRKPSTAV